MESVVVDLSLRRLHVSHANADLFDSLRLFNSFKIGHSLVNTMTRLAFLLQLEMLSFKVYLMGTGPIGEASKEVVECGDLAIETIVVKKVIQTVNTRISDILVWPSSDLGSLIVPQIVQESKHVLHSINRTFCSNFQQVVQ